MNKNVFFVMLAFLITMAFFPLASAFQYDFINNNGSWLQYTSGLDSSYYKTDLTQSTYNRDFEEVVSISESSDKSFECSDNYCLMTTAVLGGTTSFETQETTVYEGSRSGKFTHSNDGTDNYLIYTSERVGDSNVSFYYQTDNISIPANAVLKVGYFGADYNHIIDYTTGRYPDFKELSVINPSSSWTYKSINVPKGNHFLVFYLDHNAGFSDTFDLYLDDLEIKRNNTGTFRDTSPQYCNSLNTCSNINTHLPANNLDLLYWAVDYVVDATCSYYKDGVLQGNLTEGTNGIYYTEINEYITSGFSSDLNLSAECQKATYSDKSFYVSPRLYRYNNITSGNFENYFYFANNTDECSGDWCQFFDNTGSSTESFISNAYAIDGNSSVFNITEYVGGAGTVEKYLVYNNRDEDQEGAEISFDYLVHNYQGSPTTEYGYYDDSNAFNSLGELSNDSGDWNNVTFDIPSVTNNRIAFKSSISGGTTFQYLYIDNVMSDLATLNSVLTVDNNLTSNFGLRGENYTFTSDYETTDGINILGADCNVTIASTDYNMVYNSTTGLYEYSTSFVSEGTYAVEHTCSSDNYSTETESYNIEIVTPASSILTIGDKVNISSTSVSDFANDVQFIPSDDDETIEWSIVSGSSDYDVDFTIINDDLSSNQYYIYTSDDGEDYVFDDTLTYGEGIDYNSGLQKIRINDSYYYTFTETINPDKKYFRLVYASVGKYWRTIGDSLDWVNVNDPQLYEDTDEQLWDLFSDSNYTEIDSYTKEKYPDLTSSDLSTGFEFQFTAYASSATDIQVGYEAEDGTSSSKTAYLDTEKRRFSIPINPLSERAILKITSDTTQEDRIYITDYALIPKSYFVDRLRVFDLDNSELNAININGTSKQYLREGIPFKFDTSAFDINGNLETLRVEALLNGTIVKTYDYDLDEGANNKYFWNEILEGVVDLNGTYYDPADLRSVLLKATLIDAGGNEVSEQTKEFNLLQYPFFADDLELQLFSVGNKVGDNPTFRIDFGQEDPDRFLGMEVFIYDENHSRTNANYEDVIYSDELGCNFDCSKVLNIEEWVWEEETLYNVDVMLLVNTENKDYDNDLTYKRFSFRPTYRELETARILQVYERTDFTYRNDEDIPVVLQLRDVPYRDLSKEYSVYMNLDLCNADTGSCYDEGTTKFNPVKHIFDDVTGYNYYYFDNLFYTDDGTLLPDGNYIRFEAFLDEKTDSHQTELSPTLAAKCGTYGSSFLHGIFTFDLQEIHESDIRSTYGCQVDSNRVVEIGSSDEQRVLIQADHNVIGGQNQSIMCLNNDNNNNYVNNLEQELVCITLFNKSEQSIENFTVYLGNENSDYAKENYEGQYLKFEIPSEYIIFNDPLLLKQTLKLEYQTDTIDNIGELTELYFGKLFAGVANPLTETLQGIGQQTGLITNFNFDVNFDRDIDPNYVNGIFAFKIKGLKVLNQYDYLDQYPQLETQDTKLFTKWALRNGIPLPKKETTIEVYSSTGRPIIKEKVLSNLVINKEPSTTAIEQQAQADSNTTRRVVPAILKFNVIQDMLSNNETQVDRAFVPLTFTYLVPENKDPIGAILGVVGEFLENPIKAGLKYWFWFVIAIVGLLLFSKIVSNLKGNGGTTIINNTPNENGG